MSTIDMSIVQRAKRGDRAAFAALVDFYYARSLRFAVHMLGNGQDAEEAVQDTFVRVHGALHRYDEFDRFESWPVSYTHLRAHETPEHLVCRLLLEKKK